MKRSAPVIFIQETFLAALQIETVINSYASFNFNWSIIRGFTELLTDIILLLHDLQLELQLVLSVVMYPVSVKL